MDSDLEELLLVRQSEVAQPAGGVEPGVAPKEGRRGRSHRREHPGGQQVRVR